MKKNNKKWRFLLQALRAKTPQDLKGVLSERQYQTLYEIAEARVVLTKRIGLGLAIGIILVVVSTFLYWSTHIDLWGFVFSMLYAILAMVAIGLLYHFLPRRMYRNLETLTTLK